MLNTLLGADYVVWDKSAAVRFKRPADTTLYASFSGSQEELDSIRSALESSPQIDRSYQVVFTGNDGRVYAKGERVLNIRRRHA